MCVCVCIWYIVFCFSDIEFYVVLDAVSVLSCMLHHSLESMKFYSSVCISENLLSIQIFHPFLLNQLTWILRIIHSFGAELGLLWVSNP